MGLVKNLNVFCFLALPIMTRADFTYETNNGAITITHGCGNSVIIPSQINGLPVTSIATYAFYYCLDLTSLTIPESVTTIGNQAFANCRGLINLTIPNGVQTIDTGAFYGCSGLTNITIAHSVKTIAESAFYLCEGITDVTIPEGVTTLGGGAFGFARILTFFIPPSVTNIASDPFHGCSTLTNITVDPSNPAYRSQDGVVFSKNLDTALVFPPGKSGTYAIPDGVTSIGDFAFAISRGLTNLTIPNTVTNIGYWSFVQCAITSLIIPKSVVSIGDLAFNDADLRTVFFQGNAPAITGRSFEDHVKFYNLPGTTGWDEFSNTFPALNASVNVWNPQIRTTDANFGMESNQFGFNIAGTADIPIAIEASRDLASDSWTPIQTCTLTNGSIYFTDSDSPNHSNRFYRLRSP